jgi:hypothetical protein
MHESARLPKAYSKERYVPQYTSSKTNRRPGLETHHHTSYESTLGMWLLYKAFRLRRLFFFLIVLHSTHYSLSSKKKKLIGTPHAGLLSLSPSTPLVPCGWILRNTTV